MYVYLCIYIFIHLSIYLSISLSLSIYIYIYIERERDYPAFLPDPRSGAEGRTAFAEPGGRGAPLHFPSPRCHDVARYGVEDYARVKPSKVQNLSTRTEIGRTRRVAPRHRSGGREVHAAPRGGRLDDYAVSPAREACGILLTIYNYMCAYATVDVHMYICCIASKAQWC